MEKEAFAKMVLDSTDSLYRVAKAILKADADCEDAVQEAIVIAFEKLGTLRKEEYAKTWLTRILINECYRILRNQKKTVFLQENYLDVPKQQKDYSDLYQSILHLNKKQRLTVVLYHVEGYSIAEISEIMKTTQGTVKSRLSRARKQLKKYLEEESYE